MYKWYNSVTEERGLINISQDFLTSYKINTATEFWVVPEKLTETSLDCQYKPTSRPSLKPLSGNRASTTFVKSYTTRYILLYVDYNVLDSYFILKIQVSGLWWNLWLAFSNVTSIVSTNNCIFQSSLCSIIWVLDTWLCLTRLDVR